MKINTGFFLIAAAIFCAPALAGETVNSGVNIVAFTREDCKRLNQFLEKNDKDAIRKMNLEGKITVVPEGKLVVVEAIGLDGIDKIHVQGSSRELFIANRIISALRENSGKAGG